MAFKDETNTTAQLYSILRKVAEDYIVLIDVNLVTEQETQYLLENSTDNGIAQWSDAHLYSSCIADYADLFIVPEDRVRFLQETTLEKLKQTLLHQKEFIIEYDTIINEKRRHFQGRFSLSQDIPNEPHMYIGIRDITETMALEERSKDMAQLDRTMNLIRGGSNAHTVLIVEDNELNRDILHEILHADYQTLEAENGQAALDVLAEHYRSISAILLDLQMPVMDGFTFLKIMQADPLYSTIPVIIATGSYEANIEEYCLGLGAADFVSKPYNANLVRSRLRNVIRLRESAASLAAIEFDELTGVYTRTAFFRHVVQILQSNPDVSYTLCVSDIEDFRKVKEIYGMEIADQVLKLNSNLLKSVENQCVLLGRIGSDIFAALVKSDTPLRASTEIVMLEPPPEYKDLPKVQIKYGIYQNVDHNLSASVLCDRAVMALNTVKHKYGHTVGYFTEELQRKMYLSRQIEASMQDAYEKDQFRVYYQAKHDAATGRMVGAEALIRWQHPQYGFMNPGEFIPIFEANGFISWADYYVWKRTCSNLRRWLDLGLHLVPISCNASRVDFSHEDFIDKILGAAQEYRIDPAFLHIEVTESVFSNNIERIVSMLNRCRELGYQIELDDFGSGYSSLNTLTELPLDVVKLDMSFMKEIHNPSKNRVLSACINLAKALSLKTTIEGVETEEQLETARLFGVDYIQGYYYSKPIPEDAFEDYLRAHTSVEPVPAEPQSEDQLIRCIQDAAAREQRTASSYFRSAVNAVSRQFETVYAVDLDANTAVSYRLANGENIPTKVMESTPYLDLMQFCLDNIIAEGGESMRILLDLPALKARLREKQLLSFYYKARRGEELRFYEFEVFAIDASANRNLAVMAIRDVNEERIEAVSIINSLTTDYGPLYVVDFATEALNVFRFTDAACSRDIMNAAVGFRTYTEFINYYMSSFVDPAYREQFRLRTSLAYVSEHLVNGRMLSTTYIRIHKGIRNHYQMCFGLVDRKDGVRQFTFGFRNIDSLTTGLFCGNTAPDD